MMQKIMSLPWIKINPGRVFIIPDDEFHAKASMVWLKNMDDVLTEDFDGVMQTFGLIVSSFHPSLSSLL